MRVFSVKRLGTLSGLLLIIAGQQLREDFKQTAHPTGQFRGKVVDQQLNPNGRPGDWQVTRVAMNDEIIEPTPILRIQSGEIGPSCKQLQQAFCRLFHVRGSTISLWSNPSTLGRSTTSLAFRTPTFARRASPWRTWQKG